MELGVFEKANIIMQENKELNKLLEIANEMRKQEGCSIKIVSRDSQILISEHRLLDEIKESVYNIIANKIANNEIKFKNL